MCSKSLRFVQDSIHTYIYFSARKQCPTRPLGQWHSPIFLRQFSLLSHALRLYLCCFCIYFNCCTFNVYMSFLFLPFFTFCHFYSRPFSEFFLQMISADIHHSHLGWGGAYFQYFLDKYCLLYLGQGEREMVSIPKHGLHILCCCLIFKRICTAKTGIFFFVIAAITFLSVCRYSAPLLPGPHRARITLPLL